MTDSRPRQLNVPIAAEPPSRLCPESLQVCVDGTNLSTSTTLAAMWVGRGAVLWRDTSDLRALITATEVLGGSQLRMDGLFPIFIELDSHSQL